MKMNVLLFGISADLIGASRLEFELEKQSSVADFKELFQEKYSNVTQLNSYAVAVNENYASDDLKLQENDVIAIIPPVSGG